VVALTFAMLPKNVRAQDTDNDGFTDEVELAGITLHDGTFVPSCPETGSVGCMDPNVKDLFIILVSATPTNIPANALEFISKSHAQGGLGIVIHQIDLSQAADDRSITSTSTQKAIKVMEDLDPSGNVLGYAQQGTPNGLDNTVIYTQRIINHIDEVCTDSSICHESAGSERPELYGIYIRQTLAHEVGHLTGLAVDYNARFGGNHYKTGSNVMMDQSVKYTNKGGKVTFYVPQVYSTESQAGMVFN
jgi:hypothetical protein